MNGSDNDISDGDRVGLNAYHAFGRTLRRQRAASRWALLRAVDQALEAARWRQRRHTGTIEDEASNVTRLDATASGATPTTDWYLASAKGHNR